MPDEPLCVGDRPARWVGEDFLDKRGVYLWTLPRPDRPGLRLFHVGCSYGKTSSLRDRTLIHYNNFFAFAFAWNHGKPEIRRLDKLPGYSLDTGDRRSSDDTNDASDGTIIKFLQRIRLVYLAPEIDLEPGSAHFPELQADIRRLEGAIARACDKARPGHLTNTVRRTAACDDSMEIAAPLNAIPGVGPLFP